MLHNDIIMQNAMKTINNILLLNYYYSYAVKAELDVVLLERLVSEI